MLKKTKYITGIVLLLITYFTVYSQNPYSWQKYYLSQYSGADNEAMDIFSIGDTNFIIAGNNFTPEKGQVMKVDAFGNLIWRKYLDSGYVNCCIASEDNGILVSGQNIPNIPVSYALKLNSNGDVIWRTAYDSGGCIRKIIKTNNNEYLLIGSYLSKGLVIRIDSLGNLIWRKYYQGSPWVSFVSACPNFEGGFLLLSSDNVKAIIFNVNDSGNVIWSMIYEVEDVELELYSVERLSDRYLIGGSAFKIPLDRRFGFFTLIDMQGNFSTERFIPHIGIGQNFSFDFKPLDNRRFVTSIISYDWGGVEYHSTIMVVDSNCSVQRQLTLYGTSTSYLRRVITMENGGLVFAGLAQLSIPGFITTYVVRTDTNLFVPPIGIKPISSEVPNQFSLSQNCPNPFNPTTKIKFEIPSNVKRETSNVKIIIYDILGREVAVLVNEQLKPGTYEVEWNASNYPSGVYFYRLTTQDYSATKKMVLIK